MQMYCIRIGSGQGWDAEDNEYYLTAENPYVALARAVEEYRIDTDGGEFKNLNLSVETNVKFIEIGD